MKLLLLLYISIALFAYNNDKLNLLEDLDNASEISTRTKLNIDKTPAIISILHANELKRLGITDLYTALETIPGIELSKGIAGAKQINMRGNKSLVRDKIKLMIDGISVNAEISGASFSYLDMPIELIERIEVIRGPASAIYGSFAHIGVINVITKSATHKKGTVFANANSEHANSIGFTQHLDSNDIKVAIDSFFKNSKNSREYNSYSLLPQQNSFTSYEDFTNKSLGLNIKYKGLSFSTRWLELENQNYYGYGAWPIVQDPKKLKTISFINELLYAPKISQNLFMDIKIGYKKYTFNGYARIHPYSIQQPKTLYPPYDLLGDGFYTEKVLYGDIALKYNWNNHNILLGTYLSHAKEGSTTYYINDVTLSEETNIRLPDDGIKAGINRYQYAFYFNDIYTISDRLSANLGVRYDHYNDADSSFAPKLALLYNYNEMQSYKLMYQRSFRAPAWVELYGTNVPFLGDPNLKSETIDTLEFAYRYQAAFDSWININFFYTKMHNFITRDANFKMVNTQDTDSYGTEIELKTPLHERLLLQTNYSYVYMENKENEQQAFLANHLLNIMLSYKMDSAWHVGTRLRHVGKRAREREDDRADLKAYTTFDQTVTFTYNALSIQGSIKNIFDEKVIYPAPLGNGTSTGTYLDDFTQDGRVFWLSLEWRFE